MKADTQPAAVGTVISRTLRPQDLIPAFTDELMARDPRLETLADFEVALVPAGVLGDDDHEWWAGDECMSVIERLHAALNEVAPEGTVFGAHDGDAADFGFWPVDPETGEIVEEKEEQRPARVILFKTATDGDAEAVKDLLATGVELAEQEGPTAALVILVGRDGSYSQYVAATTTEHAFIRAELHVILTEMTLEALEDRADEDEED
jgi:hypothetical protein